VEHQRRPLQGKPARATLPDAQIAQLVEQRIENPRVGGSNPPLGTILPPRNIPLSKINQ
jgi:hypothetical protein